MEFGVKNRNLSDNVDFSKLTFDSSHSTNSPSDKLQTNKDKKPTFTISNIINGTFDKTKTTLKKKINNLSLFNSNFNIDEIINSSKPLDIHVEYATYLEENRNLIEKSNKLMNQQTQTNKKPISSIMTPFFNFDNPLSNNLQFPTISHQQTLHQNMQSALQQILLINNSCGGKSQFMDMFRREFIKNFHLFKNLKNDEEVGDALNVNLTGEKRTNSDLNSCIMETEPSKYENVLVQKFNDRKVTEKPKKYKYPSNNEKRYKCSYCSMAFSRSNTLKTHERIHTGEKPFPCAICGRCFRQPGNLTRHQIIHTKVRQFNCPICPQVFKRQTNLRDHFKKHAR